MYNTTIATVVPLPRSCTCQAMTGVNAPPHPSPLPKGEGPKGKPPIIAKPHYLPKGHDFKGLPEDGKELL